MWGIKQLAYHALLALNHPISALRYIQRSNRFNRNLSITAKMRTDFLKELDATKLLHHAGNETGRDLSAMRQPDLYTIIRILKPNIVVETGIDNGFSSLFALAALKENGNGHLHSIEFLSELGDGKTPGWLVPEEYRKQWTIHTGDSTELLPALMNKLAPVDLFIHDSLHTYEFMMQEFRDAWPHLKTGGWLMSDDTGVNQSFFHFCREVKGKTNWTPNGYGILQHP